MKVFEFIEITDENADVALFENNKVVSFYNGKDAIDKKYNNREVVKIENCQTCIGLTIR